MSQPQHATADNERDIQFAVHDIAQTWIKRGVCPECIVRQIVIGASVVAMDARGWKAVDVHEAVDDAFSADTNHIRHGQH